MRDVAFFDDALNFLLRFLTIFVESFYCHIFYDLGQKNSTIILWSVDALVVNGGDLGQGKYIFGFVEKMNINNRKVGNYSINLVKCKSVEEKKNCKRKRRNFIGKCKSLSAFPEKEEKNRGKN